MGGIGSGKNYGKLRPCKAGKTTTNFVYQLNVTKALKTWREGGTCYTHPVDFSVMDNSIHLQRRDGLELYTKTISLIPLPCHFGGERLFGVCPFCKRKVISLYFYKDLFACRSCLKLTYQSQNDTLSKRLTKKFLTYEKILNNDPFTRPKWMREKTFQNVRSQYFDLDEKSQIAEFFSLRNNRTVTKIFDGCGLAVIAADLWEMNHPGNKEKVLWLYDDFYREAIGLR